MGGGGVVETSNNSLVKISSLLICTSIYVGFFSNVKSEFYLKMITIKVINFEQRIVKLV